jgi:hypothetical protein
LPEVCTSYCVANTNRPLILADFKVSSDKIVISNDVRYLTVLSAKYPVFHIHMFVDCLFGYLMALFNSVSYTADGRDDTLCVIYVTPLSVTHAI